MLHFITSCSVHVGDESDYESGYERQMVSSVDIIEFGSYKD